MATSKTFAREQQVLGEHGEYPGHPVTLACMVMARYPDLAAARHKAPGQDFGAALQDSFIPGAGCAVHAALDTLRVAQTEGIGAAYDRAERYWAGWERQNADNVSSAAQGRQQAERLKPLFEASLATWGTPADPGSPYRLPAVAEVA